MDGPLFFVVTGIMAAGKSTVAQALAERFPASVHVRGETFRRFVVNGYAAMTADPTPQALDHLRLRYRLAAATADAYVEAGFVTVVQDVIIGDEQRTFLTMVRTRPLALVVLAPGPHEVARREATRAKTGYGAFTPRRSTQSCVARANGSACGWTPQRSASKRPSTPFSRTSTRASSTCDPTRHRRDNHLRLS